MFWYVGKIFLSAEGASPGTSAYSTKGEVRLASDVYESGRVIEARCYDFEEGTVLVKWTGTPPMDWTQLSLSEAREHYRSKEGREPAGM